MRSAAAARAGVPTGTISPGRACRGGGEKRRGFAADRNDLDLASTLNGWDAAGAAPLFKLVVSLEQAARLNLRAYAGALAAGGSSRILGRGASPPATPLPGPADEQGSTPSARYVFVQKREPGKQRSDRAVGSDETSRIQPVRFAARRCEIPRPSTA